MFGVAGCRARAGARARGPGDRGRAGRCTRTPVPVVALLSDWANARDASARGATRLLAWEPETGIAEQVKPQRCCRRADPHDEAKKNRVD